jgi:sugar phosphate isomerase/epimerase
LARRVAEPEHSRIANPLREHDLKVVSLCRGGFFAARDLQKRMEQIDENKRAIEEAHELGAPLVVLVCGADPSQSLEDSQTD